MIEFIVGIIVGLFIWIVIWFCNFELDFSGGIKVEKIESLDGKYQYNGWIITDKKFEIGDTIYISLIS